MPLMPYVTQNSNNKERVTDIYSCLLDERIIFIGEQITDSLANLIVAQLLYLESVDSEKDITLYIQSGGGSVSAGMSIFDTMNYIKCDVSTVCIGTAASMAAFLLSSGTKGKRYALPNSEIMIHQPLGGTQGQASDILIHAKHIEKTKEKLNIILSKNCNQPLERIIADTDRDNFMSANEALEYGIVDHILDRKVEKKNEK